MDALPCGMRYDSDESGSFLLIDPNEAWNIDSWAEKVDEEGGAVACPVLPDLALRFDAQDALDLCRALTAHFGQTWDEMAVARGMVQAGIRPEGR